MTAVLALALPEAHSVGRIPDPLFLFSSIMFTHIPSGTLTRRLSLEASPWNRTKDFL